MKGLLVKDLLMMRQHIFLTLIIILVYAFVAVTANGMAEVFSFITIFLGIFFPVNTLAYDDKAHWDRLALSMPVSRTTVILSKYLGHSKRCGDYRRLFGCCRCFGFGDHIGVHHAAADVQIWRGKSTCYHFSSCRTAGAGFHADFKI